MQMDAATPHDSARGARGGRSLAKKCICASEWHRDNHHDVKEQFKPVAVRTYGIRDLEIRGTIVSSRTSSRIPQPYSVSKRL